MKFSASVPNSRAIGTRIGSNTRPTTSKVRKAIFDTLYGKVDLVDAHVVDLFAGTGSLGFEAVRHGATSVTFVDNDNTSIVSIRRAIEKMKPMSNVEYHVVRRDVFDFLKSSYCIDLQADICFCDPPYEFDDWEKILKLRPARYIVAESNREVVVAGNYKRTTLKVYGGTTLTFMALSDMTSLQDRTSEGRK